MKATDKISKIIGNLEDSIKELEGLKTAIPTAIPKEKVSSAEYSSAEYVSSHELASELDAREIKLMESSSSAETSAEYTSAESSAESKGKVFFSPGLTKFWPRFKYLSGEIVGNLTKTRTMALDDFNVIHSLGYKSDMHIKTDTLLASISRETPGHKGFIGTVDASNGITYFMPAYSTSIGKLERQTGKLTLENKFPSTPQVRSGAEGKNGVIYMPSYTRTLKIYTYDTKTGETTSFTPEKPKRSGIGGCNHIWGAATDKKGEIYMPQVLGSSVAKIDKNGVFKYLEGPPATSGVSGWTHKYVGAIYVEAVDKVFCLPRCGKKILIINCVDDTYEEVDLPADYLKVANKNKNFHGFLGPDGWVYSAFWADTKCFRINPHTNEIQWKDYEYEFMDGHPTVKAGSGIMSLGTGYSTAALVKNKSVYLGLAGTSRAIKLEF